MADDSFVIAELAPELLGDSAPSAVGKDYHRTLPSSEA